MRDLINDLDNTTLLDIFDSRELYSNSSGDTRDSSTPSSGGAIPTQPTRDGSSGGLSPVGIITPDPVTVPESGQPQDSLEDGDSATLEDTFEGGYGGGGGGGGMPMEEEEEVIEEGVERVDDDKIFGMNPKLFYGLLIGAAAIGGYVYLKKKKIIKL